MVPALTIGVFDPLRKALHHAMGRPDGVLGILLLGHRNYVGGKWEKIGRLQADFVRQKGLRPNQVFLDIACGALRAGVHLIPYLNRGNYLGIEKEERLVRLGVKKELGRQLYESKAPEFVISAEFEFDRFSKKPDFALAQSLFTHLEEQDILNCMYRLRRFVNPGTRFFATYFIGDAPRTYTRSHALRYFAYTRQQTEAFGEATGWKPNYIGSWSHPRHQMIVEYTAE
jgi:SAM-dependent methyltransferase